MTPAEFSVRGPHGTVPWVAIVDGEPMLIWAASREQAEYYVYGHHRSPESVRMFRADPGHHLGRNRVVPLTELA